jgi:polyhydroxyalkanoate synthesis repressor PhaR
MPHCVIDSDRSTPPAMPRVVKRYGSRKLYDTASSRYVSLDELAAAIRGGEQVQVLDNRTGDDVTTAVLTQIISEEGRRGEGHLSTYFLHDLIRIGERISEHALRAGESARRVGGEAVEAGLEKARQSAGEIVSTAGELVQRLRPGPVAELRDEVDRLRARLEALEDSLDEPPVDPNTPTPP